LKPIQESPTKFGQGFELALVIDCEGIARDNLKKNSFED
jgi:hypothetical protein